MAKLLPSDVHAMKLLDDNRHYFYDGLHGDAYSWTKRYAIGSKVSGQALEALQQGLAAVALGIKGIADFKQNAPSH